jgi:hypothetical protein
MARHTVDVLPGRGLWFGSGTYDLMKHYWYKPDYPHELYECSMEEWSKRFGDGDARTLAKTVVGNIEVSSVFLGLGENWETMLFGNDPRLHEAEREYQWRYQTYVDAAKHHVDIVMHLMAGGHPDEL